MRAVCLKAVGNVEVADIPGPVRKPGEALVKIKAVSVCGSDINAYRGRGMHVDCPRILGHEAAGVIEQIDPSDAAASGLRTGDAVVLDPYMYCGSCYACSLGRTNCCETLKVLGVQTDGAMCAYMAHPVGQLIKADASLPWELLPVSEPLTIALHALHRTEVRAGEHVAIIGAGPIGLMAAMAARRACGAEPVLIDVIDQRLAFARARGIVHTINANGNVAAALSGITGGRMCEAVIEASGANSAIRATVTYASYCGRIALTGWPSSETRLATDVITRKELQVYGARNSAGEFAEALRLIAGGEVDAGAVLSAVVSFEELPAMIARMAGQPEQYLKVAALLP